MKATIAAGSIRLVLVAFLVAAVFAVVVGGLGLVAVAETAVPLPFVAAAVSVAAFTILLPRVDRLVRRITRHPASTPYSALAKAAEEIRGGSLEQALPGLAEVLAQGTRAQRAVVWLAVGEKLVSTACYPAVEGPMPSPVANLATLLAQPDTDHVVPVLDGPVLRAALTISKPGLAVTPADQRLMQDIAYGAGLLLGGAQLNAELEDRVYQAGELATQLQASRQRLTRARDVERHRLIAELNQIMTDRVATLRAEVGTAMEHLRDDSGAERAQQALARARTELDELLDRFRVIVRGVYPAVLREQGPAGALEELAADLPRPVRLTGGLARRAAWEIESGIYWLAAAAMQQLAGRPAEAPLHAHLEGTNGHLTVRIHDPTRSAAADDVLAVLADDVDRLVALGGDVQVAEDGTGGVTLRAWLPEQLEPSVELTPRSPSSVGSGKAVS